MLNGIPPWTLPSGAPHHRVIYLVGQSVKCWLSSALYSLMAYSRGGPHYFAIVNRVNMDVHIFLWKDMEFSGYLPRNGIVGSYSSCFILTFLRNLQTDFHKDYTNWLPNSFDEDSIIPMTN